MRAIILAAGVGQRLGAAARDLPKCLLRFAGRTLLQRHLELLQRLGVRQVDLVLGYQADTVHSYLAELACGLTLNLHYNRDYEQGSVVSLRAASDALRSGDDVLVMDADVLYSPRILARLVASGHANCFLLDRDFEAGEEPVKICVRDGRMVEFRKRLCPLLAYDYAGESVGFFRFSGPVAQALATQTTHYVNAGMANAPHEEALRDLLLASPAPFGFEDITGEPWIEIDFEADLARAAREIQPAADAVVLEWPPAAGANNGR